MLLRTKYLGSHLFDLFALDCFVFGIYLLVERIWSIALKPVTAELQYFLGQFLVDNLANAVSLAYPGDDHFICINALAMFV